MRCAATSLTKCFASPEEVAARDLHREPLGVSDDGRRLAGRWRRRAQERVLRLTALVPGIRADTDHAGMERRLARILLRGFIAHIDCYPRCAGVAE